MERSVSIVLTAFGPTGFTFNTVTPADLKAATRSLMKPLRWNMACCFVLLAVEIQILDHACLVCVAVRDCNVVVEVLAASTHTAHVQRHSRSSEVENLVLGLAGQRVVNGEHPARSDLEFSER
jgi:hypothetical protein